MNRKIIAAALATATALTITACDKKTKASSKAISVATQAVAVADKYLNGVVSYDQIKADLNNIQNEMKYAENGGTGTDEQRADFSISLDILHLSTTILFDSIDKNAKSYDEVLEARNELAEDAGLTTRS